MDQSSTLPALLETSTIDDSYGLGFSRSLSIAVAIVDVIDPPALLEDSTCPFVSHSMTISAYNLFVRCFNY
jgi:hypothetical protein